MRCRLKFWGGTGNQVMGRCETHPDVVFLGGMFSGSGTKRQQIRREFEKHASIPAWRRYPDNRIALENDAAHFQTVITDIEDGVREEKFVGELAEVRHNLRMTQDALDALEAVRG